MRKRASRLACSSLAGDEGFEPPNAESESGVLPVTLIPCIHAPVSKRMIYYTQKILFVKPFLFKILNLFCVDSR